MSIGELTGRAMGWVEEYRSTNDRDAILGRAASRDAAALWRVVRAFDEDTASNELVALFSTASIALGCLYYCRYRESDEQQGRAELARALLCLEPVSDDYRAVPSELNPLIGRFTDPDAQGDMALTLLAASSREPDPALLDAAILLMTPAAAALSNRDARRCERLSWLCLAHRRRYQRDGTVTDLDRSVAAGEEAVAIVAEHGMRATEAWSNLAFAYWCRHRLRADVADLRRVIDLFERTMAVTGAEVTLLADLGSAYRQLYEHTGDPAHIQRAVTLAEQAVSLSGDRASPAVLGNLCGSLLRRYERTGARTDLWRAAELSEQIVAALPPDAPDRGGHLAVAASVLYRRHERSRALDDLHRAVDLYEQTLSALADEDLGRPEVLRGLARALHQRHLSAGADTDLDRAVTLAGWALAALPRDHADRGGAAMELATVHMTRYGHNGVLTDLAYAIELGEEVVASTTNCPPEWLSTLGNAYQQRYPVTGAVADLDRAIRFGEMALAATADDDFARAGRQVRLTAAYRRRHGHQASRSDLDRAVGLGEQAVARTPADHVDLPEWLSNLAQAYLDRYRLDRAPSDVDAAADLGENALAILPANHPGRLSLISRLCAAHLERRTGEGGTPEPGRLQELATAVADAAVAAPVDRVSAHHAVGTLAQATGEVRLAVEMLDSAIALLPSVAPREAGWADQQHRIGGHLGLVGAAVAAHCATGDPAGAVEIAELGRGVLLASQANTRVDLVELRNRNPRLADRFRWACDRLNTPDFPVDERKRWWAEYDALLAEIRELPGLADFLATPRLADLRPAVAGGYAVLVNATRQRGDAVVVQADADPYAIELPDLRLSDVEVKVGALLAAFDGTLAGALRRPHVVPEILGWLWDAIVEPVVNALPSRGMTPHRVWWLPIGPLGLLPLHAAGHPGQDGALDAAVSSYVPSLRILRAARHRAPPTRRRSLTVALQHTPDHPEDLPGAVSEATMLGGATLLDEEATAERVMSAIEQATWAHFACHAFVDPSSPADSGLRLHDRTLPLPEVGGLRLTGAELAYLSACSTANHGIRYADEVLHLASAFQFAGFRHVVASLWPLADGIAVDAARSFYRGLPDTPVADEAATVLHEITRRLRDERPDRPDLWASLVHSGP